MQLKKMTIQEARDNYSLLATCLVPMPDSIDEYKKVKKGDVIDVNVRDKKRNLEHHRKMFAILNYVVENSDFQGSADDLLIVLKYEIGYVREFEDFMGVKIITPKSINFEVMGQMAFEDFYSRVLLVLSRYMNDTIENIEKNSLENKMNNC